MSARGNPSMASMAMSVLALGGIILALYAVGNLLYGHPADERDLDYETILADARSTDDFEVLAPPERPEGWRSNHADFVPGPAGSWRLGMLTENERYIGLHQVAGDVEGALEEFAPEVAEAGTARLGGETWEVFEGRVEPETTFVRPDGEDRVVLVTGSAPREVIEAYIESLTTG